MRNVLFLCTGNSARSQIAQALVNANRTDQWRAFSAGTEPAAQVNPFALRALEEIGIHTEGSKPTHVSEYQDQPFDLVVTVCDDAAENCPVWLGQGKRVHIGFPDPAKASGTDDEIISVFREVRDEIEQRILSYLDSN